MVDSVETVESGYPGHNTHTPDYGGVGGCFDEDHHCEGEETAE